jgi:hypothetical protein
MHKKLDALSQVGGSAKQIADLVAGSSEETAQLFDSRFRSASTSDQQAGDLFRTPDVSAELGTDNTGADVGINSIKSEVMMQTGDTR